ncbi:MAG: TniQ family protein [Xanthomonadales bacterium]|nr:TniQ family protein [Xanthomonadales bacterium]
MLGSLLPDELLYSWCSRHHVVAGNLRHASTCRQLFGHPHLGSAHDFPCRLEELVMRTRGLLGTVESIVYSHTILPYYLRFGDANRVATTMSRVRQGGAGALKAALGLLATRMGAHHPLRACARCMRSDADQYGTPYWHVSHQLPGVLICPAHGEMLLGSLVKTSGEGRFEWSLPHADLFQRSDIERRQFEVDDFTRQSIANLATCSVQIHSADRELLIDPIRLASVVLRRLQTIGLATIGGRIRHDGFCAELLKLTRSLRSIDVLTALPQTTASAASQFNRLVQTPRSIAHPIRYSVLILAFFGSWGGFVTAYQSDDHHDLGCANDDAGHAPATNLVESQKQLQRAEILRLVIGGKSYRAAARTVGVDVATAISWGAAAGMEVSRRPKIVTAEVRARAMAALEAGNSREDVIACSGISPSALRYLVKTEGGLQSRWKEACAGKVREDVRRKWMHMIAENSALSSSDLRALAPAEFAWLYRNDRHWMRDVASGLPHAPLTNNARVNWVERDTALAEAVRLAVSSHQDLFDNRVLTRAKLYQLVPRLKGMVSDLYRLPLTRAAIEEVLAAHGRLTLGPF